ncbi:ferredoxin [Williamsia muralis]|uniref:ferredoxin n=1 Tax=Williamsia marianensis TaxID=85044 RepID=UPI00381927D4
MTVRIDIDTAACNGYGNCLVAAPEVFELDNNNIATVLPGRPTAADLDEVREAVADCPARALRIHEH